MVGNHDLALTTQGVDSPARTYMCLLAKLVSSSPPFSPLHLSPTLHSFLYPSLTSLPHNLPLPPFPLAFSTFPFSLLAPPYFRDLDFAKNHHVVLAS